MQNCLGIGVHYNSDYEWLIKMINMRNELSHLYDSKKIDKIYSQLNDAYKVIKKIEGV